MNYNVINDEQALRAFVAWLPETEAHEQYYYCLFSRRKYSVSGILKSDSLQLKRGVCSKERLVERLRQLEVPAGAYRHKDEPVSQECLAVYITVNPRDMKKAAVNTMVALAHGIRDNQPLLSPHKEALSEIQKAKSRTCYIDFDVDCDTEDVARLQETIAGYVNADAVTSIRTRGGFHCLVDPAKVAEHFKKTFYQNIAKLPEVDKSGDQLVPIPGCCQGGFTPYFMELPVT
jgi:hypothetical protein